MNTTLDTQNRLIRKIY